MGVLEIIRKIREIRFNSLSLKIIFIVHINALLDNVERKSTSEGEAH